MKVKELIIKLLELRDMELDVNISTNFQDFNIKEVLIKYGRAEIVAEEFEEKEN